LSHYRPFYKDGGLDPDQEECENREAPHAGICVQDIEITGETYQHSFGLGLAIYIDVLEGLPNGNWYETSDIDYVPSPDRWPN
jgi:hypothetical protein